ncbi:hypothetical protein [Pseudomonas sp. NPDC089406]|uniref:hypothetical protein n=1 Tax=Pseudomonas sp. NPDC089406 TaxID=3364463 RepID=UPI00384C25AC
MDTQTLMGLLDDIEQIVPVIDHIGSGFDDAEQTALALLLFFKQRKVLDRLSGMRKALTLELQAQLSPAAIEQWEETEIDYWKPPYGLDREQLLKLIDKS